MRTLKASTAKEWFRVEVREPPPKEVQLVVYEVPDRETAFETARKIIKLAAEARAMLPKEATRDGGEVTVYKVRSSPGGGRLDLNRFPKEAWSGG